jgi:DNA-3-methyladenine glycosylase II
MNQIINRQSIEWLENADPIFGAISKQFGVPPNWQRPPGFVSLCRIILEQQVSLESANSCYQKLKDRLTDITPAALLSLNTEEMRGCFVSRQKASYLHALASAVIEKKLELEKLRAMELPAIRHQLTQIKGIGNWTVDVYMLFCLQSPDVLPLGDVAVLRTLKELKGWDKVDLISQQSEPWRPYRSTAVFYLWHYYLNIRKRSIVFE